MNDLGIIGAKAGTDKIGNHGYHRFYHKVLNEYRQQTFGMIEIGINKGASMIMWKEYFPNAYIYGIDIGIEYKDDRCTIFKCDQSRLKDLMNVGSCLNHAIKFIIDDGSHVPDHQMLTFNYFFNKILESGGVYIIEDIELSYWKTGELYGYTVNHGWKEPNSLIERFKKLIDYVNIQFLNDNDKDLIEEEIDFVSKKTLQMISSITFCHNCIIIRKKEEYEYMYDGRPYVYGKNTL